MYTDIAIALLLTKKYCNIQSTDIDWDLPLNSMLEASKAKESYRPYIVAAVHLWSVTASARSQLVSADGASWLTPDQIVESLRGLLELQESFDAALTEIPAGWDTASKERVLCGCKSNSALNNYNGIAASFVV